MKKVTSQLTRKSRADITWLWVVMQSDTRTTMPLSFSCVNYRPQRIMSFKGIAPWRSGERSESKSHIAPLFHNSTYEHMHTPLRPVTQTWAEFCTQSLLLPDWKEICCGRTSNTLQMTSELIDKRGGQESIKLHIWGELHKRIFKLGCMSPQPIIHIIIVCSF